MTYKNVPTAPAIPDRFRGDVVIASFRLPVVLGDEFPHRVLLILIPGELREGASVTEAGARRNDKYWTPKGEYAIHTGQDALTTAWTEFQNMLADVPGVPLKW